MRSRVIRVEVFHLKNIIFSHNLENTAVVIKSSGFEAFLSRDRKNEVVGMGHKQYFAVTKKRYLCC
jgi:hypothetical protein